MRTIHLSKWLIVSSLCSHKEHLDGPPYPSFLNHSAVNILFYSVAQRNIPTFGRHSLSQQSCIGSFVFSHCCALISSEYPSLTLYSHVFYPTQINLSFPFLMVRFLLVQIFLSSYFSPFMSGVLSKLFHFQPKAVSPLGYSM